MDHAKTQAELDALRKRVRPDGLEARIIDMLKAVVDELREIREIVIAMNKMVGLDADGN